MFLQQFYNIYFIYMRFMQTFTYMYLNTYIQRLDYYIYIWLHVQNIIYNDDDDVYIHFYILMFLCVHIKVCVYVYVAVVYNNKIKIKNTHILQLLFLGCRQPDRKKKHKFRKKNINFIYKNIKTTAIKKPITI